MANFANLAILAKIAIFVAPNLAKVAKSATLAKIAH